MDRRVVLKAISGLTLFLLALTGCGENYNDQFDLLNPFAGKYKIGDCITPTDPTYTWYGEYAEVKAFSEIEGYRGKSYVLEFRYYNSTNSLFDQSVEEFTEKVSRKNCD